MDTFFILCAKYLFLLAFVLAGGYFLKQPREVQVRVALYGGICAVLSYGIALLAGKLYFDPRPFVEGHFTPLIAHDTENGFPSDHILMLSCIASVFTVFNKRFSLALWLITLLVGTARVYVGVHHPIDIAGSIFITLVVSTAVYFVFRTHTMSASVEKIHSYVRKKV